MAPSDPTFAELPSFDELFDHPTLADWRELAEASLKGRPVESLTVRTHEGLEIAPLFTADDPAPGPGFPGQAPFVRGRTALGAGSSGWRVCPLVNDPDPEAAAELAAEEAERGADALWLVIDSSLRTAEEEQEPLRGDGTAIHTSTAFDPFFDRLDATTCEVHLDAGGNAAAIGAAWLAAARRHDVNPHALRGSLGCDPLGALARDGVLGAGLDGSYDQMAELASWTAVRAPGLRAATVSTLRYHMAGASAIEELAYALATGIAYLRALTDRGLDVGTAAARIGFRHAIGRDLFVEAAKLRAGRRLWSRATDACGVAEADRAAPIHAVVSPRGLTTRDPWVNMLRTTVGSFAAAVGGADTITVLPFDFAIGAPDDLARRIATNSQTILREESHVGRVVDPGGGSWYLESITDRLAHAAWARFQMIEAAGGMAHALGDGVIAGELRELRFARSHAIATGREPVTGVSSFPNLDEGVVDRPTPSPTAQPDAHQTGATQELAHLFTASCDAPLDGTLVDLAMEAAGAGASVVQLAAALRGTRSSTTLTPLAGHRDAEAFERLRDASDAWLADSGARPKIFLANMGPAAEHRARAGFATHFFEAGGIEAIGNDGFDSIDQAVSAFLDAGTRMAVICSSDARDGEVVAELARALDTAGARTVLVAGRPGDHEQSWRDAGVAGFVHVGCDQVRVLTDLLKEEGVLHV
ncbi:MAG: methylmalonyl-CoA mutase family protein [Holophagae bacterium]|jgi:methylmalonyl-CoA mutase